MLGKELCTFINNSPSPFHAVAEASKSLLEAGFIKLQETNPTQWSNLHRGGKYFFTRNSSTLIAFSIGSNFKQEKGALAIVAAHTDSPCLKLKPNFHVNSCSKTSTSKESLVKVPVQTYGGGLWHTWFDRDLSVAGRIIVQEAAPEVKLSQHLVNIPGPILKIPSLAIHLNRAVDSEGFKFNRETHLVPISGHEENALLQRIRQQLPENSIILDGELCLYDAQPATIGGLNEELVFAARLDNLLMTFCGLKGFIQATSNGENKNSFNEQISMLALFDNEEVGSVSAQGADSTLLSQCINRIFCCLSVEACQNAPILARSMLVSADCAHAVHPNWPEMHESQHKPTLNAGPVLKVNANQRYATTSITAAIIKQIAAEARVNLQEFVVRNDTGCGSTIGPLVAAGLAVRTVDLGNPQLSMHSIRETAGAHDVESGVRLMQTFYQAFGQGSQALFIE
jgi:aspartyl aminopeptidase